ncbi:hypothetical protein OG875_04950 [Streptomyces sp. NBC_01498]|uniref:hypothetical protein n=1 Tax=Streptomyces sp. NBC_01498 TaxID=2975870 RepID=UPI002E7C3C53|nr:hypothetical protein [Streptomyces sp. NBC_01498]WTL24005.1 hypothetical protein OG875_04950 [Streptomyces sp. NBC_01498]
MPKTVYRQTKRDAKELSRTAKRGDKLYVIRDIATNLARYEDAQLYSEYTVTGQHPLLGGAMISGSLSVEGLVLREGPVYTKPPKGIRNIAGPGPQVDAPLPERDNVRPLSAYEIRQMEKQVEANKEDRKPKRKTWWA